MRVLFGKDQCMLCRPALNIIGNVSSNTSILILQGENDSQTPVEQAFLLQANTHG